MVFRFTSVGARIDARSFSRERAASVDPLDFEGEAKCLAMHEAMDWKNSLKT